MNQPPLLSEEVRALVGFTTPWLRAANPVESSEVRRFLQATMEIPRGRSDAGVSNGEMSSVPLGFPMHALRTELGAPDPLANAAAADFDGYPREMRPGLPVLSVALKRIVNGGYEHEFYRHARQGESIECRSCYLDITERAGKEGPLVIVRIRDEFRTAAGDRLMTSINTMIFR